ncbi:MAG: hypothetical protein ACKVOI_19285 [Dongiaceae bacterium]
MQRLLAVLLPWRNVSPADLALELIAAGKLEDASIRPKGSSKPPVMQSAAAE